MAFHGSCAAFGDDAVVLLGPPGSGKSDLLLQLIDRGFELVGDDQFELDHGRVRPAFRLDGLMEVRGLGIFHLPHRPSAQLRLAVHLDGPAPRLPEPRTHPEFGIPEIRIDPVTPTAAIRITWALEAVCGRKTQSCGAFAS